MNFITTTTTIPAYSSIPQDQNQQTVETGISDSKNNSNGDVKIGANIPIQDQITKGKARANIPIQDQITKGKARAMLFN